MSISPGRTVARFHSVRSWYTKAVRPVLGEYDAQRILVLDEAVERLTRMEGLLGTDLRLCVLGKAGVGKSTLLNALVDDRETILPQGGIGPLTAQAIVVRHSTAPFFEVTYHGRNKLNQLLFALHRHLEAVDARAKATAVDLAEIASELDDDERKIALQDADDSAVAEKKSNPRIDAFIQQGRLLVQGDQFAAGELSYLVDGLRECLGMPRSFGSELAAADLGRIELIRSRIPKRASAKHATQANTLRMTSREAGFAAELHRHAAGCLAPLVNRIEVGWPAPMLGAGATVVDLPGVGISNDEYRTVTNENVRAARAIALVVDRAGVDEASADMLRDTGFLNSLLFESGDEVLEPVHLFVAVVKLDLTADDLRRVAVFSGAKRPWIECFDESCAGAITLVRGQVERELGRIVENSSLTAQEDMRKVVERVLTALEVHPVAAMEFRKLNIADDEDRARIKDARQSRVPQLSAAITRIAAERRERIRTQFDKGLDDLEESIGSAIELLRSRGLDEQRAEGEVKELLKEFDAFTQPLAKDLAVRRGAFREFLRETVPTEIEARVREASDEVRQDIQAHLHKFRKYHWATLKATIRKGGTHDGARHVDLPSELTLKFEEPIAVVWAKKILTLIRRRTNELGQDHVALAVKVVEWTRAQGARVQQRTVEALEADLRTDTKQLAAVGRDAVDELKTRVRTEMYDKLSKLVQRSCEKFVEQGQNSGRGVQERIHEFLGGALTEAVLAAARPGAQKVLTTNYQEVQDEILRALKALPDPIERARELVIDRHASLLLRADQDARAKLLASIDSVVSARNAA